MGVTYSYALLPVSKRTYDEIEAKLKDAGYSHAIDREIIDMHGIALELDESVCADVAAKGEG